jgi:FAD/FMN-containing dehydrogenase/Fe-S oxidoreductase
MGSTDLEKPAVWLPVQREALERRLRKHCDAEVRFDAVARVLYSTDASIYQIEPIGVVIPRTRAALAQAVEIAVEQRVPMVPRGGGTSLSGQSIGHGLVIDCRKYLNRILEFDIENRWVRVEPGVVLAQLNQFLDRHGLQFGPDVATSDRANIGGMIGNNSAGARSIKYGKTVDHVLELEALLSDARTAHFGPVAVADYPQKLRLVGREGEAYRAVHTIVRDCEEQIRTRFPKILRRVSGYNLDSVLPPGPPNLARLIVGSEGTLAVVASAKLNVVPLPKHRGLSVLEFGELDGGLGRLADLLETNPSAIELIDRMILDLARESQEFRSRVDFVRGRPEAILLVEHSGDAAADIERGFAQVRDAVGGSACEAIMQTCDPHVCERIWSVRKTALPLLLSLPGGRKPIAFVEDTAVDPARLPEFVRRFREILEQHQTRGSFYGHASVGCLHIRPLLDLRKHTDRRDMVAIAEKVVALVLEFGGAMSGEHGDGLARSAFNPRLFGPRIYEAFCKVKRAFDPDNLLNPGKIVEAPWITDHLRHERRPNARAATVFAFVDHGGIGELAANCNGNGLCLRENVGTMCPSFMATRDEDHSPRGRANLLRAALDGRLGDIESGDWAVGRLEAALDLCLMCKACKSECPSRVDIARVKAEYLAHRSLHRRPKLRDRMIAQFRRTAARAARCAPLSNWLIHWRPIRLVLDRFVGIDRRRALPALHRKSLEHWFKRHRPVPAPRRGRVVLLADCFTNFHEPGLGRCAVSLLESAGYQVHLAPLCCGRVMLSKGFLREARELVQRNVDRLLVYAEEGAPILGIEPSCIFTLADEWHDLAPSAATRLIAGRVGLVETWLANRVAEGKTELPAPEATEAEVLFHGHCHQKAAGALVGSVAALRRLANVAPVVLDVGCCGMAGSFGYETEHYELSVAIARQRLLPALERAPTAVVVAPGFSCRSQIADLAGRSALHPLELIYDRIWNQPDDPRSRSPAATKKTRESILDPTRLSGRIS